MGLVRRTSALALVVTLSVIGCSAPAPTLGLYSVTAKIGEGGTGQVYQSDYATQGVPIHSASGCGRIWNRTISLVMPLPPSLCQLNES